jgi:Domain of unknown function (DUF4262)
MVRVAERVWLLEAQQAGDGWRGLAAVAYDDHVGCQGYAVVWFDAEGRQVATERVGGEHPVLAMKAAENTFGIDQAAWRPAYAVLSGGPLPWAEIASRMKPPELERERRVCLTDQYGGLYGEIAGIVGDEGAAVVLPLLRMASSVEDLHGLGEHAEPIWDAWLRYPSVDAGEKAVLAHVAEYGWHFQGIYESEEHPQFGYSIGFHRTLRAPELIIVGLPLGHAHPMLWEAYRRFERGEQLGPNDFSEDFLEGYAVTFIEVSDDARDEYFGFANWFYKDKFPALQLVWPAADGRWPWEDEGLARAQPLLGPAPTAGADT